MNLGGERKAIEAALDNYRAQLDTIPDELFTLSPPGGGWSFAEVYSHILQATLGASVALERCTHNNYSTSSKGPNLFGRLAMLLGRLPLRTKASAALTAKMPAAKISKEDAKTLILKCRRRLDDIIPLVKGASPDARYKHPRLGMLNAAQWLKFIRMHLQHHIKKVINK